MRLKYIILRVAMWLVALILIVRFIKFNGDIVDLISGVSIIGVDLIVERLIDDTTSS